MSRPLQTYLSRGYVPADADTPGAVTISTASPLPSYIAGFACRGADGVATVTLAQADASAAVPETRRDPWDMIAEGNAILHDKAHGRSSEAAATSDRVILKTPGGHFRQIDVDTLSPIEKMALGSYLGHSRSQS